MASLAWLPNEVIRLIFSFLHPQDLESFAGVCKRNYSVSTDFLKLHRQNKQKYKKFSDGRPFAIPHLLETPLLASYIKQLVIERQRFTTRVAHLAKGGFVILDEEYASYYSGQKLDDVRLLVNKSGLVQQSGVEYVANKIRAGDEGMLTMMLLCFATSLECLIIRPPRRGDRMLIGYLSEHLRTVALMPKHLQPLQFQSLSRVYLNQWTHTPQRHRLFSNGVATIAPFLTLPAIEELVVDFRANLSSHKLPYSFEFEPRSSKLTVLDLQETILDTNEVDQILEGIRALKSISMHRPPGGIEEMLKRFISSLEAIRFVHSPDDRPLPSLKGFQKLKCLSYCVCRFYIREPGKSIVAGKFKSWTRHEVVKLQNILPLSMETLRIRSCGPHSYPLNKLVTCLAELVESKAVHKTNLRAICLFGVRSPSGSTVVHWEKASSMARLRNACKTRNVHLTAAPVERSCQSCIPLPSEIGRGAFLGPDACHW